jgi:spore coat protein H
MNQVPVMDFIIDTDDYTLLLANKTNNLRIPAKIFYKDTLVLGEIRATGGGSRYDPRWSFRVYLQEGFTIEGIMEFSLSAQVNDPTMVHTTITSHIYKRAGFPVIDSRHVFLRINNKDIGLYVMLEIIKEPFFLRRNLEISELYKVGFGSDFRLSESHDIQFSIDKELPDDDNYNSLLQFIYVLNTSPVEDLRSNLSLYLDIDNYIAYHALTSLINNFDAFTNNFYLARCDVIQGFEIIPWDFDRSFERSNDVGLYGRNVIIEILFQNQEILESYKAQLTLYLTTVYTPAEIFPLIDSTAIFIEEAYNLDPFLGNGRYTLEDEITDLKSYIFNRRGFFISNLDSLTAPAL